MNGTKPLIRKFHSLTGRITISLMQRAFRNVRRNHGAAGIDRQSISMFERQLDQNLLALMRDLKTGTFQPKPSRRTYVDKEPGKKRPLGIPCVRDRVAQEVLRQLLNPLFEELFPPNLKGTSPTASGRDGLATTHCDESMSSTRPATGLFWTRTSKASSTTSIRTWS